MAAHTSAGKTVVAEYAFALATKVWLASLFLFFVCYFCSFKTMVLHTFINPGIRSVRRETSSLVLPFSWSEKYAILHF